MDPERDVPEEPHVGLLDFDDIRDPETGEVAPDAAALLDQLAGTFREWSPSGTGAHALGGFSLPDGVQTLTIDLSSTEWPDAELELYPGRRYTTITGDHIPGSASSTRDIQGIVGDILATFPGALEAAQASTPASRPDELDPADGFDIVALLSQCNHYMGYCVTKWEYENRNHYRQSMTPYGPESADYMVSSLVDLAREVRGGSAATAHDSPTATADGARRDGTYNALVATEQSVQRVSRRHPPGRVERGHGAVTPGRRRALRPGTVLLGRRDQRRRPAMGRARTPRRRHLARGG